MKKKENKITQFFEKHFSKKRRNCPNCNKSVDAYLKRCPHCYERIGDSILPKKYQNMIFLTDYKLLLIFIVGFAGFLLFTMFVMLALRPIPTDQNLLINLESLIPCLLSLSVIACILSYDIKDIIDSFKKSLAHLRPIIASLIGLAIIIGFSYGYQAILAQCGYNLADNNNQSGVANMVTSWPAIAFFYTVIFGPILEELTYRLGLFTILRKRNRYLAYVVSILVFVFLHFDFFTTNWANEFANLPLYLVPAFILTILYEYEGISSSIYTHFLNNLISFIILLTVK